MRTLLSIHLRRTKERPKLYHQPRRRLQQLVASCPSLGTFPSPFRLFNSSSLNRDVPPPMVHTKWVPSSFPSLIPMMWVSHPRSHLHTFLVAVEDFWTFSLQQYKREIIDFPDGGIAAVDWALPPQSCISIDPAIPTMLILPGFTGSGQCGYIRSVVQKMLSHGWQLGILLARGSDNLALKTPQVCPFFLLLHRYFLNSIEQLFSLGYTKDLCHTIAFISKKYGFDENPHRVLVGCGFSMGANLLTKYLGEQKKETPLTGAISIGNPFDLLHCCDKMHLDTFTRLIYSRALTASFKDVIQKVWCIDFFHAFYHHQMWILV